MFFGQESGNGNCILMGMCYNVQRRLKKEWCFQPAVSDSGWGHRRPQLVYFFFGEKRAADRFYTT